MELDDRHGSAFLPDWMASTRTQRSWELAEDAVKAVVRARRRLQQSAERLHRSEATLENSVALIYRRQLEPDPPSGDPD